MKPLLEALRPQQWIKNGLVLAGVVFAGMLADPRALHNAALGFVAFSLLSGAVYLFNDLRDVEADRLHPRKRNRPIASGRLSVGAAWAGLSVVVLLAAAITWVLGPWFAATAASYLVLNLAYSLWLKHVVLVDVMAIASGFVLRAIAGVELLRPLRLEVELSPWLLVCTFFLALLMACGKRRQELLRQDAAVAEGRRRVLLSYNEPFLDTLVTVCAATTLVSYAIYTIWPGTVEKFHTTALLWTVPFVAYGVFRYLWLTRVGDEGEDPSATVIADRPMIVAVLLWLLTVAVVLYLR
ncbi:MAG: decaprenyl-phosphate phosphoribosyltransferase [Candidatus Eisenbacteria bacterium]